MTENKNPIRVFILSSLTGGTGNSILATRIKTLLEQCIQYRGNVVLLDLGDSDIHNTLTSISNENGSSDMKQIFVGIHAYRAGVLLKKYNKSGIPMILIYGGTDLNEMYKVDSKLIEMKEMVSKSQYIVSFTKEMYDKSIGIFGGTDPQQLIAKSLVISPSINSTLQDPQYYQDDNGKKLVSILKSKELYPNEYSSNMDDDMDIPRVYLLPIGIRLVKDPLYILNAFSEWSQAHNSSPQVQNKKEKKRILLIIGPPLDNTITELKRLISQEYHNIYHHDSIDHDSLLKVMKHSYAVLNTSKSEGVCTTLLEAMYLQVPCVARVNDGNAALITHNQTGLLFSTPSQLIEQLEALDSTPTCINTLVNNAKQYISDHFGKGLEKQAYCDLINKVIDGL